MRWMRVKSCTRVRRVCTADTVWRSHSFPQTDYRHRQQCPMRIGVCSYAFFLQNPWICNHCINSRSGKMFRKLLYVIIIIQKSYISPILPAWLAIIALHYHHSYMLEHNIKVFFFKYFKIYVHCNDLVMSGVYY